MSNIDGVNGNNSMHLKHDGETGRESEGSCRTSVMTHSIKFLKCWMKRSGTSGGLLSMLMLRVN